MKLGQPITSSASASYFLQSIADNYRKAYYRQMWTLSSPFPGKNQYLVSVEETNSRSLGGHLIHYTTATLIAAFSTVH
ncbi:hypothetical protein DPMN_102379 [Dreissena polymorpha]|uniref:Uncharacterized protein n=1 Tax=Dreissena polymorpha TaxID=45954 RepID=A0A9D4RAG7_DREPO|nr:hypothetical protein DPMN_102379 [Dreissena polymorpha]